MRFLATCLLLSLLSNGVTSSSRAPPNSSELYFSPNIVVRHLDASACEQYSELYDNIDIDLSIWKDGISLELMQSTIRKHAASPKGRSSERPKGFAAAFINGRVYIVDKPALVGWIGHHVGLFAVYIRFLLHLERLFGSQLPDCEFVISTIDRPLLLLQPDTEGTTTMQYEPVMRFCRTELAFSILIPNFHFYMKNYGALLELVPNITKDYPWKQRKPILFGRYTNYFRYMHPEDSGTVRFTANGTDLCDHGKHARMCPVRSYFTNFTEQYQPRMNVRSGGHIPMADHANFKWLVHLDGQGLSSRFEQLLPLGSVVFKEESGYRAYYYHMLKPYEHYIPFWKKGPEDIIEALDWAEANDNKARIIGKKAQAFALKYLSSEARSCYMFTLLQRYAKLLKYKPGPTQGREHMQYYKPAWDFLEEEVHTLENGKWRNVKFTV